MRVVRDMTHANGSADPDYPMDFAAVVDQHSRGEQPAQFEGGPSWPERSPTHVLGLGTRVVAWARQLPSRFSPRDGADNFDDWDLHK